MMDVFNERSERKYKGKTYVTWHGSPFDRGSADSWYGRPRKPHWYPQGTGRGEMIAESEMTPGELEHYNAGYDENEEFGDKKNWD